MAKKPGPKGPSKYTEEFLNNLAKKLLVYAKENSMPFLKDFAFQNNIPSEEISRTCSTNEIFVNALHILKDRQEVQLIKGALANKLNPAMAIFALKNVAGWRDKQADIVIENHTHLTNIKIKELNTKPEQDLISLALGRGC